MKPTTVQDLPPDVGGVMPDSKPPSLMIGPVEQALAAIERTRLPRVESNNVKRIVRSATNVRLGEADARVQNVEGLDKFWEQ